MLLCLDVLPFYARNHARRWPTSMSIVARRAASACGACVRGRLALGPSAPPPSAVARCLRWLPSQPSCVHLGFAPWHLFKKGLRSSSARDLARDAKDCGFVSQSCAGYSVMRVLDRVSFWEGIISKSIIRHISKNITRRVTCRPRHMPYLLLAVGNALVSPVSQMGPVHKPHQAFLRR